MAKVIKKYPRLSYKNYLNPYNKIALAGLDWHHTLEKYLWLILEQPPKYFYEFNRKEIPNAYGVYVISDVRIPDNERVVYVGDSSNLRNRLNIHLNGNLNNSPCIRYLINDYNEKEVNDITEARKYIVDNYAYRFMKCDEMFEDKVKLCGYVEAYLTAILQPRYGVYIEKDE